MKIAINLWILKNHQMEGIGWFTYYTTKYLIMQHPEVEFHLLTSQNFRHENFYSENVVVHRIFPNKRHPVLYLFYLDYILPYHLKKINPDVFLSPDGMLSLNTKIKQLPVIHDINFVHYPKDSKWYNRWYYNRYFPKYGHIAKRIATVSDYSRNDIAQHFNLPKEKIDVVYNGINEHFTNTVNTSAETFTLPATTYFLFVGSINPRKNIARLIQAFSQFRATERNAKLVIAGAKGWLLNDVQIALNESVYKNDIIFMGRLSDEELKLVLSKALALTFVPYFEGFGIPLIEAMICNVPIIASKITSLPEVAADAALYVDPHDANSISDAMKKIYDDKNLREELQKKGSEQVKIFSWENTTKRLWECIMKIE